MPKTQELNPVEVMAVSETDMAAVGEYAACVLDMCRRLVTDLSDEQYAAPASGASIGQHMRHVLDHFQAPLKTERECVVCYDHRERGVSIESDRSECVEALGDLITRLRALSAGELADRIGARFMASASGDEFTLPSTRARELAFAAHHAIHHQALISVIACEHGAVLPEGFGKAPSTLSFERQSRAAG